MQNVRKYIAVGTTSLILAMPGFGHTQCVAPRDMNGIWHANDGGRYFVRQVGNDIWWVGMSGDNGDTWTNVFRGSRKGNVIVGQWADVPKGRVRSSGDLHLRVEGVTAILGFSRTYVTGGFGGSRWSQPCNDHVARPDR